MLLSASIIVQDEEEHLPECLRSIQDLVDEIVVADTGSTDATTQVAREFGARVVAISWNDDFAAARNQAQIHAAGQWILWIDADERIRPCDAAEVRRLLADPAKIAYYLLYYVRPGFTPFPKARLYRNSPRIHFEGIIHEDNWRSLERFRSEFGGEVGESGLALDHVGFEKRRQTKHRRNLPLLLRDLEQRPEHVLLWCHLADVYAALGKPAKAQNAWEEALLRARQRRGVYERHDALAFLGMIEWKLDHGEEVAELLEEARDRFPRNKQLLWLHGRRLMSGGRYREAIPAFQELASAQAAVSEDTYGYDKRLLTVLPYHCLATCCRKLGRVRESLKYRDLARRQLPPDSAGQSPDPNPRAVRLWAVD
jgi:glycosyltransferase involved in cell wall biosynthesis